MSDVPAAEGDRLREPQAQGTMAGLRAFGEELRAERERRGVSMERLCTETKVNARHFEALERGEYKALPGGVFRRGIVRAYLGCVGLPEQEWMPRFESDYAGQMDSSGMPGEEQEAWATFAANVKKNRTSPRPRNTARWLGVLALFLLLTASAWALWRYVLRGRLESLPATPSMLYLGTIRYSIKYWRPGESSTGYLSKRTKL